MKQIIQPASNRFKQLFEQKTTFPLWMMRQAGRYLPEYRQLRQQYPSFLDRCCNPEIASLLTLQPLQRFELDAAIIFADILLPLLCFSGIDLRFHEGKGPCVVLKEALQSIKQVSHPNTRLSFVSETIHRVSRSILAEQALIGFCGSPWTVSFYVWEGSSSKNWERSLAVIEKEPSLALDWLHALTECSISYLAMQAEAGAQQLMIFDSWAGIASPTCFERFVYPFALRLMKEIKQRYPLCPLIYYPKGAVEQVLKQSEQPFDILACDSSVPITHIQHKTDKILQGNLDPFLFCADSQVTIDEAVAHYFSQLTRPTIVNLGTGLTPVADLERVTSFVKAVRAAEKAFLIKTAAP